MIRNMPIWHLDRSEPTSCGQIASCRKRSVRLCLRRLACNVPYTSLKIISSLDDVVTVGYCSVSQPFYHGGSPKTFFVSKLPVGTKMFTGQKMFIEASAIKLLVN